MNSEVVSVAHIGVAIECEEAVDVVPTSLAAVVGVATVGNVVDMNTQNWFQVRLYSDSAVVKAGPYSIGSAVQPGQDMADQ